MQTTQKSKRVNGAPRQNQPIFIGNHLEVNSKVCHGQLIFRGTRVPVETVLSRLARGRTFADLRESWPEVSQEAVVEAVNLATDLLVRKYTKKPHA